jgi:hypothetical protein
MKRQTISRLLLAAVAFLGLSAAPAFAIDTPPSPPPSCVPVTAGSGAWPLGQHVFRCGAGATVANATLMLNAINTHRRVNDQMSNLAGSSNRGNFYLYDTFDNFITDLGGFIPLQADRDAIKGDPGFTVKDSATGFPLFTAVFQVNGFGGTNNFIANTAAHEFGHWADWITGSGINKKQKITLSGTATINDQVTLTIANGNFTTITVTSTVTSTNLAVLASSLAAAVHTQSSLNGTLAKIDATASGSTLTATYVGAGSAPLYSYVVTGAKTEQLFLDTFGKATDSAVFKHALHGINSNDTVNGDVVTFNSLANCTTNTAGVFNKQRDATNRYICSTKVEGLVGGTKKVGNITLEIRDSVVNPKVPLTSIVVDGNQSLSDIATAFVTAITGNINLSSNDITASSVGTALTLKSASGAATTFTFVPNGSTVTLQLQQPAYGTYDSLTVKFSIVPKSNWLNLQAAWPGFYSKDQEVFAEYYAVYNGFNDRTLPGSVPNNRSLDWYLQFTSQFPCINNVIATSINTLLAPTSFPAGCPVN